ncbi:MAG: Clp1/GlmU family protein [Actinomycetota bacterium]
MNDHEALVERAVAEAACVMLVGGLDSGKTTLGRAMVQAACRADKTAAFIDADVGQKSVGPPTTIGLKLVRTPEDAEPEAMAEADALSFVGATSPQGHMLAVVTGAAHLLMVARERGADFIAVDTSGMVSGVYGQLLKYHKIELLRPDLVVGLQRGEELDPLLGIARRFFAGDVYALPVHPAATPTSVEQRAANRETAMRRYFTKPLQKWRVKPTVFMPTLPALFELKELDRLVVGLSDGQGTYLGIGYLEHSPEDGVLRLISPVAEAPKALRLGSVRLEEGFRAKRVDLRNLFGTD